MRGQNDQALVERGWRVDDVDEAHHPVVLVSGDMAVEHPPAGEVSEVDPNDDLSGYAILQGFPLMWKLVPVLFSLSCTVRSWAMGGFARFLGAVGIAPDGIASGWVGVPVTRNFSSGTSGYDSPCGPLL